MLYEDVSTGEISTYMALVRVPDAIKAAAHSQPEKLIEHGKQVLTALYDAEIVKRIGMDVYKTAKTVPVPTAADAISAGALKASQILHRVVTANATAMSISFADTLSALLPSKREDWDRAVWTDEDCVTEVLVCLWEAVVGQSVDSYSYTSTSAATATGSDAALESNAALTATATAATAVTAATAPVAATATPITVAAASESALGRMSFDKDDHLAMRFVCASSNMRSRIFGIPPQSFHDAKVRHCMS
jgi:hypothetical protein